MRLRISCLAIGFVVVCLVVNEVVAKVPYTVNPGKPGSGWSQESSRFNRGSDEYQRFWLDVPAIAFMFKGVHYSIGGSSARVTAKWDVFLKANGSKDYDTVATYSRNFLTEGYQLKLNNFLKSKIMRMLAEVNIPVTVRHEVMHFLVDQKYGSVLDAKPYADRHFVQEMMAYMGEGLSEDAALARIEANYPRLASAVKEFRTERSSRRLGTAKKIVGDRPAAADRPNAQQLTPVRRNPPQPSITMDDVLNALREDGSGVQKAVDALRE